LDSCREREALVEGGEEREADIELGFGFDFIKESFLTLPKPTVMREKRKSRDSRWTEEVSAHVDLESEGWLKKLWELFVEFWKMLRERADRNGVEELTFEFLEVNAIVVTEVQMLPRDFDVALQRRGLVSHHR
jgi:hypothetical protein